MGIFNKRLGVGWQGLAEAMELFSFFNLDWPIDCMMYKKILIKEKGI